MSEFNSRIAPDVMTANEAITFAEAFKEAIVTDLDAVIDGLREDVKNAGD